MPVRVRPLVTLVPFLFVGAILGGSGCNPGSSAGDDGKATVGDSAAKGATADAGAGEQSPEPEPVLTQDQLKELYTASKNRTEATPELSNESFAEVQADLRKIIKQGKDAHLRTNASLMLGSLFEARGDRRAAISYYRQARALTPQEPSTHAVLALALSAEEMWKEAIEVQTKLVEMTPDDLFAWLLLGEMYMKGGRVDDAPDVYGAYELRRKGLLDGLTLKKDGEYVMPPQERMGCAQALAPAADTGTGMALLYALESDPDSGVRTEIASVMGTQRLIGYKELLTRKLETETDEKVKEAITWALEEIARDPVETAPGVAPQFEGLSEEELAVAKKAAEDEVAAEIAKLAEEAKAAEGAADAQGSGAAGAEAADAQGDAKKGAAPAEGAPATEKTGG